MAVGTRLPAMSGSEWAALLLLATAMSFTPGPNTTLAAAMAANHGLPHAMRFVLGVPLGWGAVLLACAFGLGALLQAAPLLRGAITVAGVAYMLWLAWKLAGSGELKKAGDARGGRGFDVGFWQAAALQFVNIKAWILALVVSTGWVVQAGEPLALRLVQVVPVLMLFALASNFTYAWVGATLRRWLAEGRRLLYFNRVLALLLAATAVWMVRA
jgi:threonine/homoserine/homoserine lactone efflux protein